MDKIMGDNGQKVILEVHKENNNSNNQYIDLIDVVRNMNRHKRLYIYLLVAAIILGGAIGFIKVAYDHYFNHTSYARALISFQYDGIESGLDPNGASFDINKIKSPAVIQKALNNLGISTEYIENVRSNISVEGVIPEDAVERITVINKMAEDDAKYYEQLLDVSYFPSQYVVYFYDDRTFSVGQVDQILNAILESYKEYFFDTYANNEALTVTAGLLSGDSYDYSESVDLLRTQLKLMKNFAEAKASEAPDFRASGTGLSFTDIATSIGFIQDADLARLSSYIETNSLTTDSARQIEYYEYQIEEYTNRLSELQVNLSNVTSAINSYQKDPVIIVSNQDTTQETEQSNEYYDKLIAQKLELSSKISEINTEINRYYNLANKMQSKTTSATEAEINYANTLISNLQNKITEWIDLIEETTEEYNDTTKFSNAYQVSVPAQYFAGGGIVNIAKTSIKFIAIFMVLVVIAWTADGVIKEMKDIKDADIY
ncbi:hypothetical protein SAMN04487928_1358 [Butyrivibrio proteoclasticus]|uniref:Uncharacterized protein n=1 Tax=Butyrivibrio proteoclasticus TaxID=43305 RepID=A0A1I5XN78_9FIRM|nr:hypothetical protein [Butyrivibrio proteoclasticus]SFQ33411.1 hypothetical protein SAMN04487928_1358 [Butyrivibrio proteoclasticus]